ncbi:MAG TPA: hypothetical protein VGE07_23655 [Herpetosiphonaceae bacterium]
MSNPRFLRQKWTFRAGERQVVLIKSPNERPTHVVMKALLWALYMPQYPDISIEIRLQDRYKPDVVAFDAEQRPLFWGEAGQVGADKLRALFKRYRATHFAVAKWETRLDPVEALVRDALDGLRRSAPVDLINFTDANAEGAIAADGALTLDFAALEWRRISLD